MLSAKLLCDKRLVDSLNSVQFCLFPDLKNMSYEICQILSASVAPKIFSVIFVFYFLPLLSSHLYCHTVILKMFTFLSIFVLFLPFIMQDMCYLEWMDLI